MYLNLVDRNAAWFMGSADLGLTTIGTQMCSVSGVNAMLYLAGVAELGPGIDRLIQNGTQHMSNYVKAILMATVDIKLQRPEYKALHTGNPRVPLWYVFHDGFNTWANMAWQRRAELAFNFYTVPGGMRERYRNDGLEQEMGNALVTKIDACAYGNALHYPLAVMLNVTRTHAPGLFGEIMRILKGACADNRMANFMGEFATSDGVREMFR